MSIFHLTIDFGSKAKGELAVDKHDYIMRLGRFTKKHDGPLVHSASGNMPAWAAEDPRKFWIAADEYERANGALYHEVEYALPRELSHDEQIAAAHELAQQIAEMHPYSLAIHGNQGNPHAHLIFTSRKLDGIERAPEQFFKRANNKNPARGGCAKVSLEERGTEWVKKVRRDWQDVANRHLEAAGKTARIDCRSHAARGLDKAPGVHLGRGASRLEQRGKTTRRGLKNREAKYLNAYLHLVNSAIKDIKEKEYEHHGRNGKTHHHRAVTRRPAPERAFTAWRHGDEDHQGLRASKHARPQRMPPLRQQSASNGFKTARDAVLQRSIQGSGSGNHSVHLLHTGNGELDCGEKLDRRQAYKAQLLEARYLGKVSHALSERLLYVDRQNDHIQIKLRGGGRVVDWGDKICATTSSYDEIQAMVELAISKGWSSVEPHGSEKFKQAAWLAARRAGLSVRNYNPPSELEAQFHATRRQQERGSTMNEISDVMDATTKPTAPPNRWMAPMNQACSRLQEQLDTLRQRLNRLAQTDLKTRARELTEQYADDGYREALGRYKAAKQAIQNANILTRKRLQQKQAEARKLLEKEHARLITTPAITQALAIAKQDNDERAKLTPEIQRLHDAIQFIKVQLRDLESGRDPEIEFRQAWERRKLQPLPLWQQAVLATVFEVEEQAKREQEQAQLRAKNEQIQREKDQRLQREALAYQRAERLREKLDVCQDEAEQAMLQRDISYYQALADGHDEQEARELANAPSRRPRPF